MPIFFGFWKPPLGAPPWPPGPFLGFGISFRLLRLCYPLLRGIDLTVYFASLHKLRVRTNIGYFTVVENYDFVGVLNGAYSLSDYDFVVFGMSFLNASRIFESVKVSTALVESSKMSILGFFKRARAIQRRCF